MSRRRPAIFSAAIFSVAIVAGVFLFPLRSQQKSDSLLIVNAQIADGTGAPLYKSNLRIAYDRIVAVGNDLKPEPNEPILDAKGLVLAPGFVDIHNHSEEGLATDPLAETQIAQGITTLILGADGYSQWPMISWVRERQQHPASVNIGSFIGHATVREQVMGKDFRRIATPTEIFNMKQLVGIGMHAAGLGLSSGLEYESASYSNTDEVIALAKVAAADGGIYMTHIRDEADKSFEALKEEIAIADGAHIPVEHSHIKLGTVGVQGKAAEYIKIIEAARARGVDFLADCYPYDAWHSNLKVLVPDKQWEDPKSVERALADVGGASHITITDFTPNKSYVGHTIADLAAANKITPVQMYIRMIREGDAANTEAEIIGQSMIESDIKMFYQQPWVMVASDGGIGAAHPRGAGTFPKVLGVYVREKHWLTLPQAVYKMTGLPAKRLGWTNRGTIRVGNFADLVLFNPDSVIDKSTYTNPTALPVGIEKVFVNGMLVWDSTKPTGAKPGYYLGLKGAPQQLLN